jgi:exosortase
MDLLPMPVDSSQVESHKAAPMSMKEALQQYWPWLAVFVAVLGYIYKDVLGDMFHVWLDDENNSHGLLVPVVCVYLIMTRRKELLQASVTSSLWGLWITLIGVLVLMAGWVATEFFAMRASLVVILFGTTLFWFGPNVIKVVGGPIAYLILMVPVPAIVYDAVAMPLRVFVTQVSVFIMKSVGIIVMREGNVMIFPNITLEVVNACSGLRSMTSLLALSVAFALLFQKSMINRLILVLLTLPIALITNMARVVGTGILAQYFGAAAAEGFFHEFAGMVIFISALALLFTAHLVLRRLNP